MTKQELIEHLGTVAKSGTTQFVEKMAAGGDLNMIGQFGVGFYSVYLVSDRVVVRSKSDDDPVQHIWESSADATFRVGEDPAGNTLGRGTEITMYLKDDAKEYLDADKLESLIKKYSEFITFPIYLYKSHTETVEVPVEEEEEEDVFEGEDLEDEEGNAEEVEEEEAESDKPKTRTEEKTVWDWELMNEQKAIWSRDKSEITDEEYTNFYKTLVRNSEDEPLTWTHFKAEGEIDFKCILYLPKKAPADLYEDFYHKKMNNLHLYVRKVLIQDSFDDLLPRYLSFVVGVVDSDDLPLNVSREQLSQDKVLKVMGKKIVRKAIEMIKKLAEESATEKEAAKEEKEAEKEQQVDQQQEQTEKKEEGAEGAQPEDNANYIELWEQFGKSLKIGVIEDSANRNKLARLLRYKSSTSEGKWTSLENYVKRMKDWQKQIYFVSGDSEEKLSESLFLEAFKRRGVEVLFFTEAIDEYVAQNLREFNGKTLQDITKEGVELGDEKEHQKKVLKAYEEKYESFTKWLKELLGDKVDKVEVSDKLESAPAVLSTSRYGYSATMERIMKSQALQNPERAKYLKSHKIMEINPRHPIISGLQKMADEDPESDVARDFANLLYDSALMNSGFMIDEPNEFATRLYSLMKESLQLDSLDLEPEIEVPEEPEEANEDGEEEEEEEEESEGDENTIKLDLKNGEQMDEDEFREQLKKDRKADDDDDEL